MKSELSRRERQVLQAIANTGSDLAAAETLGIDYQTVKNHTLKIRHKLEVRSTLQAVYVLMQRDGTLLPMIEEYGPAIALGFVAGCLFMAIVLGTVMVRMGLGK